MNDFTINTRKLLSNKDLDIVKSLIKLYPNQNRNIKHLIDNLFIEKERFSTIEKIFSNVLSIKMSNKDLSFFFNIISTFHQHLPITQFLDIKFSSSIDKYSKYAIYLYFRICKKSFKDFLYEHKAMLFVKLIDVIELDLIVPKNALYFYDIFKLFVNDKLFLESFVRNRLYINFPFLTHFLVDYSISLDDLIVQVGYDCPLYKSLIYSLSLKHFSNYSYIWLLYNNWENHSNIYIPFTLINLSPFMTDPIIPSNFPYIFSNNLIEDLNLYGNENHKGNINENHKGNINENIVEYYTNIINEKILNKKKYTKLITKFNKKEISLIDIFDYFKNESKIFTYLRLTKDISLKVLGEFLCKEKNENYLKEWLSTFKFNGLDLLESLRMVLGTFVLGGEAQIIDRVISNFVEIYTFQNEDNLPVDDKNFMDDCHSLAYSFIFLNTMLHNPNIEKKISFEDYLSRVRIKSVKNNSAISVEEVKKFYFSIKTNEIKLPEAFVDTLDKFQMYKNYISTVEISNNNIFPVMGDSDAIIAVYRYFFIGNLDKFTILEPEEYYKICFLLGMPDLYIEYLCSISNTINKYLLGYKIYLENYKIADSDKLLPKELTLSYLETQIEKTYGTKSFIKHVMSGFASKKVGTSNSMGIDAPFYKMLHKCLMIDKAIFMCNIPTLIDFLLGGGGEDKVNSGVSFSTSQIMKDMLESMIYTNIINYKDRVSEGEFLFLFKKLGYSNITVKLLETDISLIKYCNDIISLKFLSTYLSSCTNPSKMADFIYSSYFQFTDNFDIFTLFTFYSFISKNNSSLEKDIKNNSSNEKDIKNNSSNEKDIKNNEKDIFNEIIEIEEKEKKILFIEKRFKTELNIPLNLIKVFTLDPTSIQNINYVKNVHVKDKDQCLLCPMQFDNILRVEQFKRVGYIMCKNFILGDSKLYNYTVYLLNYLSLSLIYFCMLIDYLLDHTFIVNGKEIKINIRILTKIVLKRLRKDNLILCCDKFTNKEGIELSILFSTFEKVKNLNLLNNEDKLFIENLIEKYKNISK